MYWLPYVVITIPLAVAWTRLVFIGPEPQTTWHPFRFGMREFAYLATSIGLGLGLFILPAIAGTVTYLFWSRSWSLYALLLAVILLAASFYAGVRLSFVLPSIAVDKFQGIAIAWRQTRRRRLANCRDYQRREPSHQLAREHRQRHRWVYFARECNSGGDRSAAADANGDDRRDRTNLQRNHQADCDLTIPRKVWILGSGQV